MATASKAPAAVLDASFVVGFCAKEANKFVGIQAKLDFYAANGWELYAPGVLSGEVMYALCKKRTEQGMPEKDYDDAVLVFTALMQDILPPPRGEVAILARANEIQDGYGCSRTSDSFYIALAEHLQTLGTAELATTDAGMKTQAQSKAPSVIVDLLPVSP